MAYVLRDRRDGFLITVEQLGLFGLDHAHDDGVDPYLRRPLDRQCAGETFDARLGRTVGRRAGSWPTAADAGDVHNRTAALLCLHHRVRVL